MIKPDWSNSILNVSATLANYLGKKVETTTVDCLENALKEKDYRNIVFLCVDGLGMYPLCSNLEPERFLRRNVNWTITSVFPSTTTNATTTLATGSYPSRHGYFGWCLYFKELDKVVDIFKGVDHYSQKKVDMKKVKDYLAITPYFASGCNRTVFSLMPQYCKDLQVGTKSENFAKIDEYFVKLSKILKQGNNKFVYTYIPDLDQASHDFGVRSAQAKVIIEQIDSGVEKIAKENPDTLFVITADHGETDIDSYISLYDDSELMATLKTPLFLEPRACGFWLKDGMEEKFLEVMKKYKDKLTLKKSSDMVREGYFGPNTEKTYKLGDYIAICKRDNDMILFDSKDTKFKGHHTGLSDKEMLLPLIIADGSK